jgi:hypothetical protein
MASGQEVITLQKALPVQYMLTHVIPQTFFPDVHMKATFPSIPGAVCGSR